MDFRLTDKQKRLVSTFREFGRTYFKDEQVMQWCKDQGLPDEIAQGFVDLQPYFETPSPLASAPELALREATLPVQTI